MTETLIGYARCSTDAQDLTAQRDRLRELGVAGDRIYLDHGLTGTTRNRPGDPRCRPAAHSTASSCPDTRSRVRTRAPAGAAATNGAATGRSDELTRHDPARLPVLSDAHHKTAI